ncbi:MAG: histidinol-phosphatase [Bacteroidetes Order II. Incertae sedis bacterium]|jgi:hypothetical protein|nr:histidinol-phosphatase [Bacteroidetes Order II. bacterium]MBT4052595.1 histidinol-phosphatase [Bacteroidetes Order II. bacterium]MBT4602057.1 histidinol-phosphatase [Bacteroidetes Order II. bacterium]MBT5251054.1 histidinol-phosphatase [Bacteroidetes Order II. bacterium]MBT6425420.1 histidinol-phosphatase [Bacteroidetes Order II. bacterium]
MSKLVSVFIIGLFVLVGCQPEDVIWQKGNLHTHSFWSDGDDFPEAIASWYRENGYDFLAISDHNTMADSERWLKIPVGHPREATFEAYLASFGADWVEYRIEQDTIHVRLKTFEEYASRTGQKGEFLLIHAEEVTDRFGSRPIHINATNIMEYVQPRGGGSVVGVMQNNLDAIFEQKARLGAVVMPHINHPNFGWGIQAEELALVDGEQFFEVYNGHPSVNNLGDSLRMGMEKMWDVVNTLRIRDGREMMFGIATDDAHHYQEQAMNKANVGRGWVMVKSNELNPEALIGQMEAGAFYASSGVSLRDVTFEADQLTIEVQEEEGVLYTIEYFGTLAEHDPAPTAVLHPETGEQIGWRYSDAVGRLLQTTSGTTATYTLTGDELYVRARVTSSKPTGNPNYEGEPESAWVQPVQPAY